jgi:malyl-CoA/(S)-citramalyl-CoA lyase
MLRSPRDFFQPLAIGAPEPLREIPVTPSRMIHFLPSHNDKLVARVPETLKQVDVLLGNLEDAVPAAEKVKARRNFIQAVKDNDFGTTGCWTRVNSLDSPWFLDDVMEIVAEIGDRLDVMMIPKVLGPEDITYVDRLLAQLEARHQIAKPIMVHAILETGGGVAKVEEIAIASPRMQGMSLGPADLAASRRMKTTRAGGGHPGYVVRTDPDPDNPEASRPSAQQDPWHYTMSKMVDACVNADALPYYGPFTDISDPVGCEDQFRAAFLLGCVGAWSLHPSQIGIARKVFSPEVDEVKMAMKIMEAIPDGSGVAMVDGKMQDDATWKQAQVMVNYARMVAERDPELAAAYGFE